MPDWFDWFQWMQDSALHDIAHATLQGKIPSLGNARDALRRLKEESEYHIRKQVGNAFYARYFPTKRIGSAWGEDQPIGVVDHYTAGISSSRTLRWFSNQPRGELGTSSAHFVIGRDGVAMMLVDPRTTIAWHAKVANRTHIGIEHVNAGLLRKSADGAVWYGLDHPYPKDRVPLIQELNSGVWEPYTSRQIVTNIVLKRWLRRAVTTLRREHFTDHQRIDPQRKVDCGPLWPLESINLLVHSTVPVKEFVSLVPTHMTKNAVALFNSEVPEHLSG